MIDSKKVASKLIDKSLLDTIERIEKEDQDSKLKETLTIRSRDWRYLDLDHLEDIPGIGWLTVEKLRLHGFRDVADVFSTSCSEWGTLKQVKGIGEKTAKELFRLIEKYVPKRSL